MEDLNMLKVKEDWRENLNEEVNKDYYKKLIAWVKNEYKNKTIYPKIDDVFNAIAYTSYNDVKCVLLGQDPYHGKNQAMGLSFSVNKGIPIPKSLQNIYKELQSDIGCYIPNNGDLTKWARQGVLLLNTALTVQERLPNSHSGKGWEILTDKIIELVDNKQSPVVFMLWGNNARSKKHLITNPKHLIIETSHPSPLGAYKGFIGSKCFSSANDFLKANEIEPIDWQIENI